MDLVVTPNSLILSNQQIQWIRRVIIMTLMYIFRVTYVRLEMVVSDLNTETYVRIRVYIKLNF